MNDTSDTSVLKVKTNDCSFDNNNVRSREYDDIFFQKDEVPRQDQGLEERVEKMQKAGANVNLGNHFSSPPPGS